MQSASLSSLGKDDRTNRQIAFLLAVGFLGLAGATGTAFWVQKTNEHNAMAVAHTLDVESRIHAFTSANERAETARRGYLLQPNGEFRNRMEGAQRQRATILDELGQLTADNPQQQDRIHTLHQVTDELDAVQGQSVTGVVGIRESLMADFAQDRAVALTRQVRELSVAMLQEEQRMLTERQHRQGQTIFRFNLLLVLTTLLVVALSAVTLTLIRRTLADLRLSRQDLNRLNASLESQVEQRTEALRRANSEIQRFAYIVSHDLRAPLVNVMGFTAELQTARDTIHRFVERLEAGVPAQLDPATRVAIEEDLPEAIGFIRRSTQKMDQLINSILRLSREGRRTLAPEPVDLAVLVRGVVDTLRHRASETDTQFDLGELPTIVTDRISLERILANLLENALKYLRPGVPGRIAVHARPEGSQVIIEVADNGRGIPANDHERIFELFRRSGAQDQPGEGIGLAHVRALTHRLGGEIEVASTPGEGSTFRLSLPLEWRPGDQHA